MYNNLPKYVVVLCKQFGTGTPGWRLHEVDSYCFAENYITAKQTVDEWKYCNSGGLSFMIKYENWLAKNGPSYDGKPFLEQRYLYNY